MNDFKAGDTASLSHAEIVAASLAQPLGCRLSHAPLQGILL